MDILSVLLKEIQQLLSTIAGIQYCALFPTRRDEIQLPAILINLAELSPSEDLGTDELALLSHWEARILLSDQMKETDTWSLVQAALYTLSQHTWPTIAIGRVRLKHASPDHFSPDYPGHRIWLIEWCQPLLIGENCWDGRGVIPSQMTIAGVDPEPHVEKSG